MSSQPTKWIILMICMLSYTLVESCYPCEDTKALQKCASLGSLGAPCSDTCGCNSSDLLTCISSICTCNLTSQGEYGASCNTDCACKGIGLKCLNGKCLCETGTSLLDTYKCVMITKSTNDCDALLGVLTSGAITPFVSDASTTGWKCNAITNTIYSPTYNPISGTGKYIIYKTAVSAADSYAKCKIMNGVRIQPLETNTDFYDLIKKYEIALASSANNIWLGATISPLDGKPYWDDGTIMFAPKYYTATMPGSTGACLYLQSTSGNPSIVEVACIGGTSYTMCQF